MSPLQQHTTSMRRIAISSLFVFAPAALGAVPRSPIGPSEATEPQVTLSESATAPDAAGVSHKTTVHRGQGKYPLTRTTQTLAEKNGTSRVLGTRTMVADHILVQLKAGATRGALDAAANRLGGKIRKALLHEGLYLVELDGTDPDAVPKALRHFSGQHTLVQHAEPDYVVQLLDQPNDPMYSQLWGMAAIQAESAWAHATGNRSAVVAIVDTGIDLFHPDLQPNIWSNPREGPGDANGDGYPGIGGVDDDGDGLIDEDSQNESRFLPDGTPNPAWTNDLAGDDDENGLVDDYRGWDFYNDDNDPADDNFHGTHVAGTIGAQGNNALGVTGVNWAVSLMPLKFLNANGSGYLSDAIDAIDYATRMHVLLTSNSWGILGADLPQEDGTALFDAIERANAAGILFVAAAGNSAGDSDSGEALQVVYPAAFTCTNIISVAATDETDGLAWFSNFGLTSVDLGAPGVNILSTFPTVPTLQTRKNLLKTGYETISGTSMACPHVAGACALVKSSNPDMTHAQIKEAILGSVDAASSLSGKCVTGGRLNADGAVTLATSNLTLVVDASSIDDDQEQGTSGNGDGILNPGEVIGLNIAVRNTSDLDAADVTAVLSLENPDSYVTVTQAGSAFSDIPAQTSSEASTQFLLNVSSNAPILHEIKLLLTLHDTWQNTWTRRLSLYVQASAYFSGAVTLDGVPQSGVQVLFKGPTVGSRITDAAGTFEASVPVGTYTIFAAKEGWLATSPVVLSLSQAQPVQTGLAFGFTTTTVSGTVTDTSGSPVPGADVKYCGDLSGSVNTEQNGSYTITCVLGKTGSLCVTARKIGSYLAAPWHPLTLPPSASSVNFALAAGAYQFTDLGILPGYYQSYAWDISNTGYVAVSSYLIGTGTLYWREGSRFRDANLNGICDPGETLLFGLSSEEFTQAMAVNNSGNVAVDYSSSESPVTPYLYRDGEFICAGSLEQDNTTSVLAMNDLDQLVGRAWVDGGCRAYTWLESSGIVDINSLLPAGSPVLIEASGVNNWGDITVNGGTLSSPHAYAFSRTHVLTDLGTLGGSTSSASDINDNGTIVGSSQTSTSASHAYKYQNGSMVDLGAMLGDYSSAQCINANEDVVGFSKRPDTLFLGAVLWKSGYGMIELSESVDLPAPFAFLGRALSINDAGQIVGTGVTPDGVRAFLLTPTPKPPVILSWSSARSHGGAGEQGIPLHPSAANDRSVQPATEPRAGGIQKVVVTFDMPVVLTGAPSAVLDGTSTDFPAASTQLLNENRTLEILFSAGTLPDGGCYVIDLAGRVMNAAGQPLTGDSDCVIRAIAGDADGDGDVDAADQAVVQNNIGQQVTAANCRCDAAVDGVINQQDVDLVASSSGRLPCDPAPWIVSACSRKQHGTAGEYSIDLPLDGEMPGVECRLGGPTKVVFTFSESVQADAGGPVITLSAGTLGSATIENGSQLTVTLSGVPDQSCLTITVSGISDLAGRPLGGDNDVQLIALRGDVLADGHVDVLDADEVRPHSGSACDETNFRCDVNANGMINSTDLSNVVQFQGHAAPCVNEPGPWLYNAVSRKTHGGAGVFDLELPFGPSSESAVESRQSGPTELRLRFSEPIKAIDGTLDATEVLVSAGTITGITVPGPSQISVQISGVPDQTCLVVTLNGLADQHDHPLTGPNEVVVRALYCDVNGDGLVDMTDWSYITGSMGQSLSEINYQKDVDLTGAIDATDAGQASQQQGHSATCQ